MDARSYRVGLNISPLDFDANGGLAESSVSFQSEPKLVKNKVFLTIIKRYILTDIYTNKHHEVLSVESIYEIPSNEIKSREDVYEFYKDATLSLNETYHHTRTTELPTLLNLVFPTPSIENYKREIDRVFNLLNSQN
jgi:hypothetical protein